MATDNLESMGRKLTAGNNFYISLDADSEQEAQRLFDGLSAGGRVEMPLQKMFWCALWSCFADKFGVQWMVITILTASNNRANNLTDSRNAAADSNVEPPPLNHDNWKEKKHENRAHNHSHFNRTALFNGFNHLLFKPRTAAGIDGTNETFFGGNDGFRLFAAAR
jgi:hypothetical protein